MPDLGLLYLFPLIFGMVFLLVQLALQQRIGNAKPFANKWSNLLYNLSFVAPFEWFVDKREDEERAMNHKLERADLTHLLDARTQQTLQVALFFIGIVIFALVLIGLEPLLNLFLFLVGMPANAGEGNGQALMIARLSVFLIILLGPISVPFLIGRRIRQRQLYFLKDLPLLQMFITLMLRSDATVEEVLYTLTTTETSYQDIFQVAYRMHLRNKGEAFAYLYEEFEDTPIIHTLEWLESYNEYAKIDTILSIENNQEDVIEATAEAKRKVGQIQGIIAAASFTLPFVALGLLGIAPIIYMVIDTLNNAL